MTAGARTAFRALGHTLAGQDQVVAAARIEQVQRVNGKGSAKMDEAARMLTHENSRLKQEVERLQTLVAELQAAADGQALASRLEQTGRSLPFANNRPVMTQTQYAEFHRVPQWQVHRWIHGCRNENKKTGEVTYSNAKLQSVMLDGVAHVYADQSPPPAGRGGKQSRKKERTKEAEAL